ncbi:MAG: hypothetical protein WCH84_05915 [Verrucomicrobiota bacterium]
MNSTQRIAKRKFNFDLQDHGVAVRRGSIMSLITTRHPQTGRDLVYVGFNTGGSSLIVQVDVASGKCRQFNNAPGCSAPWGLIAAPDGRVIVTSTGGQISVLDPKRNTFRRVAQAQTWFWHITAGPDGKYYLAGNAPNQLHRFDLATGQVENLGSVSSTQAYLRSVVTGSDGYLYGGTGSTRPQCIAYHIATGKVTELLPKSEEKYLPFVGVGRGVDGNVYATSCSGNVYRLENGRAQKISKTNWQGMASPRLADGRSVRCLDPDTLCLGEGKQARLIPLRYDAPGAGIFYLAEGPRGTVYGSTIMPLYLFRHTPRTGKTECLGRGAPDGGEAYSFGHCDGRLYYACYHFGNLMTYDPAKPWHKDPPGALKWKNNPKLITQLGQGHCRPRAMVVDAKKRVWVGSFPEYGKGNGGLACYDTVRRKFHNNPFVLRNQSIVALTADAAGEVIYGGTDIILGSGTPSVEKEARLFAWDANRQKLLWNCVPVPGATGILNLVYRGGKLYGTTHKSQFFIYDIATRKVEQLTVSPFGPARQQSLAIGPDGNLYGITWMSLFRWRPSGELEELWQVKGRSAKPYGGSLFHTGAAIIGGRLYFSNQASVMSVQLPLKRSLRP